MPGRMPAMRLWALVTRRLTGEAIRQTRWSQQPTQEGQLYYERDTPQPPHLPSPATAPFGLRPAASVQTDRAPPSPHPTPCHDKAAVGHDVREAVSDKPVLRCVCFDWDGTAVDSVTSIIRCWARAVKEGKKTARDNKRRRQAADGSGDCDDDMTLIRRWTRGVWRERFAKRLACRSMTCPWCSVRTMTKRRTKRSRPHTAHTDGKSRHRLTPSTGLATSLMPCGAVVSVWRSPQASPAAASTCSSTQPVSGPSSRPPARRTLKESTCHLRRFGRWRRLAVCLAGSGKSFLRECVPSSASHSSGSACLQSSAGRQPFLATTPSLVP